MAQPLAQTGLRRFVGNKYIHPLLFPAYPALALFAHNFEELKFADVWRSVLVLTAVSGIVWLVGRLATRSWARGGLVASTTMVALFLWHPLSNALIPASIIEHEFWIFVGYAIVVIAIIMAFTLPSYDATPLSIFANIVAVIMILGPVLEIANKSISAPTSAEAVRGSTPRDLGFGPRTKPVEPVRDIYVMLFDGYPRADALKVNFEYDNNPFLAAMKGRGFQLAEKCHSNYDGTLWSLASLLNFSTIPALFLVPEGSETNDLEPLLNSIRRNRVFQAMAEHDYRTYAFTTGVELAELDGYVDIFFRPEVVGNEFENLLFHLTPLARIWSKLRGSDLAYENHRERIRLVFDTLKRLPEATAQPKFVWAHVISPHLPIVFGRNGERVKLQELFVWGGVPSNVPRKEINAYYGDQLDYLNAWMYAVNAHGTDIVLG